jgi:VIT1/CCC1 family predicted Fe2+/Mn2+ transporter
MNKSIWKHKANTVLGLLVIILPFLGLPKEAKTVLFVVFGLLIFLFSFMAGREKSGSVGPNDQVSGPPLS